MVRLTVAGPDSELSAGVASRVLATLRPSFEARLPLGARLLPGAGDTLTAFLPDADPDQTQTAMRQLCAELAEISPALTGELPGAKFQAAVAEHTGDPFRAARNGVPPADSMTTTTTHPHAPGAPGIEPAPSDTALDLDEPDRADEHQTEGVREAIPPESAGRRERRETRDDIGFAELLSGALRAYRET